MSKKNKFKQDIPKVVNEYVPMWDDLIPLKNDLTASIIHQQNLVVEFSKLYKHILETDSKVNDLVLGLIKSYNDLVVEAINVGLLHATETKDVNGVKVGSAFRTGKVKTAIDNVTEEEGLFNSISQNYIVINEKLVHITENGFTGVFAELKVKDLEFKKIVKEGNEDVKKAVEEGLNGKSN